VVAAWLYELRLSGFGLLDFRPGVITRSLAGRAARTQEIFDRRITRKKRSQSSQNHHDWLTNHGRQSYIWSVIAFVAEIRRGKMVGV
jgi:hypothetical protein